MRILMINSVCGIRSTGRICTDLALALEKEGHQVKIAYGREDVPAEFQRFAMKIGNDFEVKLHGVISRLFDAQGFGSKKSTYDLIRKIKEFNPDIIHLHNIHGYYINIEILFEYLKTSGKKIICTLHDCWPFTGHCAYFDYADCKKWETGCFNCPQSREYPASFSDNSKKNWEKKKAIFTNVPNLTIVTPSHWLANLVKNSYLKNYPVCVINNGINTDVFKNTPSDIKKNYNIADKKIVLGVAAIWDKRKGLYYMIELSQKLGDDYQVVVIGVTQEQKESLPNNVIGILRTNSVNELVEWYSAAEVFVNPTLEDNYPTTNLEAIACDTPVISFETGGSTESASLYGAVAEKGDTDEICRLIFENNFSKKACVQSVQDMNKAYISQYMK